jgi:hypothetical protein
MEAYVREKIVVDVENEASPEATVAETTAVVPKSGIRPMQLADMAAVEGIFCDAFLKNKAASQGQIRAYIKDLFFNSPAYEEDAASIVYDDGNGHITSVILALPMRFIVDGEPLLARLLCAFASDSKTGRAGAARLSRSVRAQMQDMCFSDTAAPISADHFVAVGGITLPIQSLAWQKALRPFSSLALSHRLPAALSRPLLSLFGLGDTLLRRLKPSVRPHATTGYTVSNVDFETFRQHALTMTQRFAVRPEWAKAEFDWLIAMAARTESLGTLHCRTIEDAQNKTVGAVLYFGKAKRTATVLNIVCDKGREHDVTRQIFRHLDDEGYAMASGMAQPFLVNALYRHNHMTFKHRGYFCMTTRHESIRRNALEGNIYIGGLASESWSRLVTDF